MKRITAVLLCVLTVLSALPFAVSASRFEDVADGKWYTEAIEFCAMNQYMAGVSEGVFDRNGTLTRAMFVTILASVEGVFTDYYAYNPCFTDVAAGKWYSGAINWAYANGLAGGLGDGSFGYKNPVTREQIASFMLAYSEYLNRNHGGAVDTSAKADLSVYLDAGRIHSWAFDAMSWAVASGIIGGTSDTTLDPRGNCTRAQAAVIIRNFVLNVNQACDHVWAEPTCISYGGCDNCFVYNKPMGDHNFVDGVCSECGTEYLPGTECQHVWYKEACDENSTCLRCCETKNDATSHRYEDPNSELLVCTECSYTTCADIHLHWCMDATCINDGICILCGYVNEKATGHNIDEDGVCRTCGGSYDAEDRCFHVWQMPDCENDGYCLVCGKPGEKADGHEFEDGECLNCGLRECKHNWIDADCNDPRYCSLCFEIDESSPALGHDFSKGNICRNCIRYNNPEFTAHQNALQNIYSYGTTFEDGTRGFYRDSYPASSDLSSSTRLFVRPGVPDTVFYSSEIEMNTVFGDVTVTCRQVTKCSFTEGMTEMPFTFECVYSSGINVTASGTVDIGTLEIGYDSFDYTEIELENADSLVQASILAAIYGAEDIFEDDAIVSLVDYGFNLYE
ncbi:MAG: S-layer homology domain-containing protein [Clostridia bacterium]|nr:S-layer homology domain-containing protein [Clostridia bacterium]